MSEDRLLTRKEIKKPYINFGDIKNTGVDLDLNYRIQRGDWSWDVSLNLSHYKNEVLRISESDDASLWGAGTRLDGNVTRTTKGHAISEFYGYKVNGFYENVDEVLALPPLGQSGLNAESAKAWVGKFKFDDVDKDGKLTERDRTFIGSPHPDLIAGLNATVGKTGTSRCSGIQLSLGDLFNNTVIFTDFWMFNGNKSERMRDQSWTLPVLIIAMPFADLGFERWLFW